MKCWTLCGVAAVLSMTCGCQIGRRWFQFDSDSRTPAMGLELRADADGDEDSRPDQPDAVVPGEVLPVEHVEPEPRRGLRDWLRLPRGEERIPLPSTSNNGDDGAPPTGPLPEFE